jgi:hypothetical protein
MIDVSLNAFKKARLWINQLPDAEFEYLRAIQKNVQSSHEKVICNNEAAIELLINRGAKSEYGLIGAKFFNNGSDTVLKVNISDQSNTDFHNSLANSIDTVKRGPSIRICRNRRRGTFQMFQYSTFRYSNCVSCSTWYSEFQCKYFPLLYKNINTITL